MSKPSKNVKNISFKLTSNHKYNGVTKIYLGWGAYYYRETEESDRIDYGFKLKEYSFDNKTWKKIPKKGIRLKAKQTVYLRGELSNEEYELDQDIYFGGSTSYSSHLSFYGDVIEYKGPWHIYVQADFNLKTGKGSAGKEHYFYLV